MPRGRSWLWRGRRPPQHRGRRGPRVPGHPGVHEPRRYSVLRNTWKKLEVLLGRAGGGKLNGRLNGSWRLRKRKPNCIFVKVMTEKLSEELLTLTKWFLEIMAKITFSDSLSLNTCPRAELTKEISYFDSYYCLVKQKKYIQKYFL